MDNDGSEAVKNLSSTGRALVTLIRQGNVQKVLKKYHRPLQRLREELAYTYVRTHCLLNVPLIFERGEDYILFEFLEGGNSPSLDEIVERITKFHYATSYDEKSREVFETTDFSKERLLELLTDMRPSMGRKDLIEYSYSYIQQRYKIPYFPCLVHGDLLSRHCINRKGDVFFIDLELMCIANPFYDVSSLYLERKDKRKFFPELVRKHYRELQIIYEKNKQELSIKMEDIAIYLHSSAFYRIITGLNYYLKHKVHSLPRIYNDLELLVK